LIVDIVLDYMNILGRLKFQLTTEGNDSNTVHVDGDIIWA